MRTLIFFTLLATFISSCGPSASKLISKGRHHEAFEKSYDAILKKPHKSHKYKAELIASYDLSNADDIQFITSALSKDQNNYYKYTTVLDGMVNRNNKISAASRYTNLAGIKNDIVTIDIQNLRAEIAQKAYNYYAKKYEVYKTEILAGIKKNARIAWTMVNGMKDFQPTYHDYDSIYNELKLYGTTYTLMLSTNHSGYRYNPILDEKIHTHDEPLMVYDIDPEKYTYDRVMEIYIEDMDPGREDFNIDSRTVSKTIQTGQRWEKVEVEVPQPCKEEFVTVTECDSTFTKKICKPQPPLRKLEDKLVPIFETVYANIEDHTVTKIARAQVTIYLEDAKTSELIYKKQETIRYDYSDSQRSYSGDSRALDHMISSFVTLSSPSDFVMIDRLKDGIGNWTNGQLKFIRKF
jgi:hypothetical protein